jgi:PAS domain S-box-containing protein
MAKILVVDDDAGSRALYGVLLGPFGHCVVEAHDGAEGLERARGERPDLIIADLVLPTMSGQEFASRVRRDPSLESVPIVFQTARFLEAEARQIGQACGISCCIARPSEAATILRTIHDALGVPWEATAVRVARPAMLARAEISEVMGALWQQSQPLDAVSLRLASLVELGLALARMNEPRALLEKAAQAARRAIGANYAGVGILEESGKRLRHFVVSGVDAVSAMNIVAPDPACPPFRQIFAGHKAVRLGKQPAPLEFLPGHPSVHCFAGVPIETPARLYGWLHVADKFGDRGFTEEDERILAVLGAQLAVCYENAERWGSLREQAASLQAEIEQRRQAESHFRTLIETAPAGIVITEEQGHIVDLNSHAERMFGYQRNELLGQSLEILLPERFREAHKAHRTDYAKKPRFRPMGIGIELVARAKDGREFPVEISLGPLTTAKETLVSSTIVDISARKKLEDQLRTSQRLEAMGMLAGGVAHDFNNLLSVILGTSDLLLDMVPEGDPTRRKVESIRKAASSAAELTRQLLAFAHRQVLEPKVIDLGGVVQGLVPMLRRLIGEHIRLSVTTDPALGLVRADSGQIEQVILNLAINARDAMPDGGRLLIELRNAELDRTYIDQKRPVAPGPYVLLAISDTGIGMDKATLSHIFEPFFTTKQAGQGTGMGLATVHGIVEQSGGHIWAYSEPGKGSTFKVYLPRAEGAPQVAEKRSGVENFHGSETILLVEDAFALREMTREYLASLGYTVVEAENGVEALRRAELFAGPIHLLLTDVVLPEMSGRELAENFLQRYPQGKVLFVSGYTDDAIIEQGAFMPGAAFLQKPYHPRAVAEKLREILSSAAPAPVAPSRTAAGMRRER